ncbi:hypothetical protein ACFVZ8_13750 [Streptomyces sp. NPDC059558]|uniref:hypothetical protein n=1 Tax=Streptomyces sp. NPDC059558 TaxID=3346864 RepID=UPI003689B9DD
MTTGAQRDRACGAFVSVVSPDSGLSNQIKFFGGREVFYFEKCAPGAQLGLREDPGEPHGVTRLGKLWNGSSRLAEIGRKLRADLARARAPKPSPAPSGRSTFAALMREALGTYNPAWERVFLDPEVPPASNGVPPEVLGAYALSAGMPSADEVRPHDLAELQGEDFMCLAHVRALLSAFGSKAAAFLPGLPVRTCAERIAALAERVAVWRADLLEVIQGLLSPSYEFTDHSPPAACSPCGVIRMASPEVPRGPQPDLCLDTCNPFWALAA